MTHGMVCAPQPEAGLDVLRDGGNVMDAAIAGALVQMVVDPRPGNPGSLAPGKARFTALCPTIRYAASYATPLVHAIRLRDGRLDGGADPAGDGMAAQV